jgi:hypothetical protein
VEEKHMKKAKRIFIALLTLSVLFSAFALGAFAAEPLKVDFEYLLEYYEEPTLFYYDFTGEDVDYSSSMMVKRPKSLTAEFVTDDNAPGGKYLSWKVNGATTIANRYNNNNVYFNWNSEDPIDDFIINMTVSGAKNTTKEQNLPRIIISVADVECTDDDAGATFGTTVAAIDYRNQYFSYYKKNVAADGTVSGTETNTSFVVEEGKWYDVSFKYNAELGAATVKITDIIIKATSPNKNLKGVKRDRLPCPYPRAVILSAVMIPFSSAQVVMTDTVRRAALVLSIRLSSRKAPSCRCMA